MSFIKIFCEAKFVKFNKKSSILKDLYCKVLIYLLRLHLSGCSLIHTVWIMKKIKKKCNINHKHFCLKKYLKFHTARKNKIKFIKLQLLMLSTNK